MALRVERGAISAAWLAAESSPLKTGSIWTRPAIARGGRLGARELPFVFATVLLGVIARTAGWIPRWSLEETP